MNMKSAPDPAQATKVALDGLAARSRPLFSIITVTLNPGSSLVPTIDSVRAQDFRDFEHIVKDAGSTDGSLSELIRKGPGRETIVIQQPDNGIYDAMNQALGAARGEFLLFLNSGDRFLSDKVLSQIGAVLEQEPKVSLVYGDYWDESAGSLVRSPRRLSAFALYRNTLCHQACFFRRESLMRIGGFDTSIRVLADYDVLLKVVLGKRSSSQYANVPVAAYAGGGFSARAESVAQGGREARMLRRRHFNRVQQVVFGGLRRATLPYVRISLMRSKRWKWLRRAYVALANTWNR